MRKIKEIACLIKADGGLNNPSSLYYDSREDELYICDMGNSRVVRYLCKYDKLVDYRNSSCENQLIKPLALTMDKEHRLYVTDIQRNSIFQIQNGSFYELPLDLELNLPGSIAVDQDGSVYVSDFHHDRILKWVYPNKCRVLEDIPCSHVYGIFCKWPCLYITDTGHNRLLKYNTRSKEFTTLWSRISPIAVAVDEENTIYFSENRLLYCLNADGRKDLLLDRELWRKYNFDRLCHIGAIAVGHKNQLFFSDTIKNCIYKVFLQ